MSRDFINFLEEKMLIGEFSKITGISADTLRYYEKEGIIKPMRNESDRRNYSESDVKWAEFIIRLKDTGMPIREIRRYAKLRVKGNETLYERLEMLLAHQKKLDTQIAKLLENRSRLDDKIEYYRNKLVKRNEIG